MCNARPLYYFTGIPCPRGHISHRFVSTRACVLCVNEKKIARRSHPAVTESERQARKRYLSQNQDKLHAMRLSRTPEQKAQVNAASKRWKDRNRERVAAYGSRYKKCKPSQNAARSRKYTAAKLTAVPVWANHGDIRAIYDQARAMSEQSGIPYEVDHHYPLRGLNVCGFHSEHNLVVLPATQNREKYNKNPDDIAGYAKLVEDRVNTPQPPNQGQS